MHDVGFQTAYMKAAEHKDLWKKQEFQAAGPATQNTVLKPGTWQLIGQLFAISSVTGWAKVTEHYEPPPQPLVSAPTPALSG